MSHRDDVMTYLQANWNKTPIFPLDEYVSMGDLPAQASEQIILLVDFPQADESMVSIAVTREQGWREDGLIQLVLASPVGGDYAAMRTLGEELRDLFRGRRLGQTVVETVSTFSVSGNQDGKWVLSVAVVGFYRDRFQ